MTTTNFDLRITKQQAEELLRLSSSRKNGTHGMGFEIMCKEYAEDNREEGDEDWIGLTEDDLNEEGELDSDYKTFELFFNR